MYLTSCDHTVCILLSSNSLQAVLGWAYQYGIPDALHCSSSGTALCGYMTTTHQLLPHQVKCRKVCNVSPSFTLSATLSGYVSLPFNPCRYIPFHSWYDMYNCIYSLASLDPLQPQRYHFPPPPPPPPSPPLFDQIILPQIVFVCVTIQ